MARLRSSKNVLRVIHTAARGRESVHGAFVLWRPQIRKQFPIDHHPSARKLVVFCRRSLCEFLQRNLGRPFSAPPPPPLCHYIILKTGAYVSTSNITRHSHISHYFSRWSASWWTSWTSWCTRTRPTRTSRGSSTPCEW